MKLKTLSLLLASLLVAAGLLGMKSASDEPQTSRAELLARGKARYNISCAPCHGLEGNGYGPVSTNFITRPRDFTKGAYKNRSTASGQLPTDEDLDRSIAIGAHASAMPAFEHIAAADRAAIVQYIKTFCARFTDSTEYPLELLKESTPIASSPASIKSGRAIYLKMQCDNCHGAYGEGNGVSANIQHDDFGDRVHTTNLASAADFKFARNARDVYRIFSTGMNGVPMPSYAGTLNETDRWHLANYVWSLGHPSE